MSSNKTIQEIEIIKDEKNENKTNKYREKIRKIIVGIVMLFFH